MFFIINTNYHRSFATCRDHTRIHLLAGKQCCQALNSAAEANESVDARRVCELAGCRIDDGINKDHRRASGEVARPLPVIAAHRATMAAPRFQLADAWPDLATKASEPSRDASYRPSYLSWQGVGKSAAGSEQLATWFTGWVCHADVMQALAVFSALREKACGKGGPNLIWFHTPPSDGPGEPSGGTRDPGGGSQRPPDCSDGMDGADAKSPGRVKRVNSL